MSTALHILILEDSDTDRELIQRVLLREMKDVIFLKADTRDEYLYLLQNTRPDIILADNSMPQFSGTDALMLLREHSLNTPFILVTGTMSEEFAAGIIKAGAADYILKDRLIRLPAAVEAAVKQSRFEVERIEAYNNLLKSEERFRKLMERITDAFISLDENWKYTYLNPQACRLIRREQSEMLGKCVWDEFPDAVGTSTYHAFMTAMTEQKFVSNIDYYKPLDLWQENQIYPSEKGIAVFIRDISEQKRSEASVKKMNDELHKLSSHLQDIREQERIHIAREIHDELGQQLTALKMDISWVRSKLNTDDELVNKKTADAVELINSSIKTVRKIVSELRPAMLDDLGLVEAMTWHGEEVEKRFGIKVNFYSNVHDQLIPGELSTAIYRIYQELLTNAVKHSKASLISGALTSDLNFIHVTVTDNGIGIKSSYKESKGFGLMGVQERTHMLSGHFELNATPGSGTTIKISLPYENQSQTYAHSSDR